MVAGRPSGLMGGWRDLPPSPAGRGRRAETAPPIDLTPVQVLLRGRPALHELPDLSDRVPHDGTRPNPRLPLGDQPHLLTANPETPIATLSAHYEPLSTGVTTRHQPGLAWAQRQGTGAEHLVVLKPTSATAALGELAMMQYLRQSAGLPTFTPDAILVDEAPAHPDHDRRAWLVTRYNPNATNLTTVEWQRLDAWRLGQHTNQALSAIARLHAHGVAHGDSGLHNLVYDGPVDQQQPPPARPVDFEASYSFRDQLRQDLADDAVARHMAADLKGILEDVDEFIKRRLPRPAMYQAWMDERLVWYRSQLHHWTKHYHGALQRVGQVAVRGLGGIDEPL